MLWMGTVCGCTEYVGVKWVGKVCKSTDIFVSLIIVNFEKYEI